MPPALTDLEHDARVAPALERFRSLEQDRSPYEAIWDRVAEYIFPRRHFELSYGAPRIRPRRMVDTTAVVANERLAALLFGYMMPPYRPWVRPTVTAREPSPTEARWFERRQKFMFAGLQSPRSSFTSAGHESLQDDVAFGSSVIWTGNSRVDKRAIHKAMPLKECYWCENDEGVVDLLYRRFFMSIRNAVRAYPTPKLLEKIAATPQSTEMIEFLHVVDPREDGIARAFATRKPFRSLMISATTKEVASESGFDTFPYAVTRLKKRPGENYGEGMGWDALPLAMALNEMFETVMRAGELDADPPMVSMIGQIPRLDRRPGGLTNLTASQLRRVDNPEQVLRRLYEGGNVTTSVELVRDLRAQLQFLYYIDWMSVPDGGNTTATEIFERRDIRLRSMTPVVSRGEAEKLTSIADRLFDITQDQFERPPASLDKEELGWEYFSPLAQAQQAAALETFDRVVTMLDRAAVHDPEVADEINLKSHLRTAALAAGLPIADIQTPEEKQRIRDARNQKAAREQALLEAQAGAGAARDAGQAIGSLRQAA